MKILPLGKVWIVPKGVRGGDFGGDSEKKSPTIISLGKTTNQPVSGGNSLQKKVWGKSFLPLSRS